MDHDVRSNPGLLKLDLYCRGIRLDDSCLIEEDGGRRILRTRAGLGSGLEVILPAGLWTNIPVTESFAAKSPYILFRENGGYVIRRDDGETIAPITLSPRPEWYDLKTSTGKPMRSIGSLQGTYLAVYPAQVCAYWTEDPKSNCKFCSVGLNLGVDDADEKSVSEVMEVVWAAIDKSGITYVDFNTGHYTGHTYLGILEPYIREIKRQTGLMIGIQTPPHPDLSRFDHMKSIGVNRVSFCFEIYDPARFAEVCPGKCREYGLETYLKAMDYCSGLRGDGGIFDPWVSNGEIVAGLESPESTMAAIDRITGAGAIPTVCVFRPLTGTEFQDVPPPRTEEMIPVFRRLYESVMKHNLPVGIVENIHVSLVLLPEECRWFVDNPRRYALKEMKLRAMAAVFNRQYRDRRRKIQRAHHP